MQQALIGLQIGYLLYHNGYVLSGPLLVLLMYIHRGSSSIARRSSHSARTVGVLARSRAAVSEPRYDCSHAAFGLRKKSSAQPFASSGAPLRLVAKLSRVEVG